MNITRTPATNTHIVLMLETESSSVGPSAANAAAGRAKSITSATGPALRSLDPMVASSPFFPAVAHRRVAEFESSRTVGPGVQRVFIHVSEIPEARFATRSSR
jgi:hypothetical protein